MTRTLDKRGALEIIASKLAPTGRFARH